MSSSLTAQSKFVLEVSCKVLYKLHYLVIRGFPCRSFHSGYLQFSRRHGGIRRVRKASPATALASGLKRKCSDAFYDALEH